MPYGKYARTDGVMKSTTASDTVMIEWQEQHIHRQAWWRPDLHGPPPKRLTIADDTWSADRAYRIITQGMNLLWRGDFQNARQLIQALARRIDKKKAGPATVNLDITARFHQHRQQQSQRSHLLNRILVELEEDASIALRRAPDVKAACLAAMGEDSRPQLIPLRALQGYIGAYEWQKKGVHVPGLPARIHVPHGVYSPLRGEYLQLVQSAPLPKNPVRGFDIGTGSGVLAAIMALRGVSEVIATDINERALACAADNLDRLGLRDRITLLRTDMFPKGKADLIVCNPPWLPAKPTSRIELALYDPQHAMLRSYLYGVCNHLESQGEAWLIMSNLAEALGLRPTGHLHEMFDTAGLRVIDKLDTRPVHPKAQDRADPLHQARSMEVTSLWRLKCN